MSASKELLAVRKAVKGLGYSNRKVSITEQYAGCSSAIYVRIKNEEVDYEKVREAAKKNEYYERDERTQEILQGGNTFIFVEKYSNILN